MIPWLFIDIGTTQGSSSSAIPQMAPVHVKRVNGPILQVENVALDEKGVWILISNGNIEL